MKYIKFQEEKKKYRIVCEDDRYMICTKPFNPQKTVLYTLVDKVEKIRSTNNLVFNDYDYALKEDCERCLSDLNKGIDDFDGVQLSHRNRIALNIEWIKEI